MGNEITEKYFSKIRFAEKAKEILSEIKTKTGFIPQKEIFRGVIYDKNKMGSLIYKGEWKGKGAVLKIQGLKPDVEEIDIIKKFSAQNKSRKIRLPKILNYSKWSAKREYGYLIMEYIGGARIYEPPFADSEKIKEFSKFYEEYRAKSLNREFVKRNIFEGKSAIFINRRISNWIKIAESKNDLNKTNLEKVEKFYTGINKYLPGVKMKLVHGHLTFGDIFKISSDEYVLMSNLFWTYRPEYYDATFHLWAGIKSIRDLSVKTGDVIKYVNKWLAAYKKLPSIKPDKNFEMKFAICVLERCIGALLIDIHNQRYAKNKKRHIIHLNGLFSGLFDYFLAKLNKKTYA